MFCRKDFKSLSEFDLSRHIRLFELLFGLLRSRDSSNIHIAGILQPCRELTKRLSTILETISAKAVAAGCVFASRVKLEIADKPEDDKTPDLLYALQLYLTGSASMNAIRVTGIVDEG